ncbi:hypothetical protein F7725_009685 [Dissostichus mawsoni]|uniref:DUF4371 domain-containing protein n=1 Tax=Dissostichus mawsoni TaxID=36200 RepID=A0A7J5XMT3_DISMA|nr:hypothetical protein F7725_009685 [Dissostichus mawsoni]
MRATISRAPPVTTLLPPPPTAALPHTGTLIKCHPWKKCWADQEPVEEAVKLEPVHLPVIKFSRLFEASGWNLSLPNADETTDVSCKSQMVIVLRYIMPDLTVTERFLEFLEVKDKTCVDLSNSIKAVLEPLKLKEKLIAQTYDGAAVMSGNVRRVQTVMRETYPNAQFVHCYAHQRNLTMQQLCSARMSILKVFFADLTAFSTFISGAPKRVADLAEATQRRIPRPPAVRWNFKSRTVNAVWETREALLQCVEDIRKQPGWDAVTISEAYGLSKKLRDRAFMQLLEFLSLLMPEVDVLYNTLQKRSIDAPGINSALCRFKENVQKMRQQTDALAATTHDGTDEPGRRVSSTAPVMKEACDTVISQVLTEVLTEHSLGVGEDAEGVSRNRGSDRDEELREGRRGAGQTREVAGRGRRSGRPEHRDQLCHQFPLALSHGKGSSDANFCHCLIRKDGLHRESLLIQSLKHINKHLLNGSYRFRERGRLDEK